jgi:hypothetical protein
LKEIVSLGDVGIDGRIILKYLKIMRWEIVD